MAQPVQLVQAGLLAQKLARYRGESLFDDVEIRATPFGDVVEQV